MVKEFCTKRDYGQGCAIWRKRGDGTKQDISVLEAAGFSKAAFIVSSEIQQSQGILNLFAALLDWKMLSMDRYSLVS